MRSVRIAIAVIGLVALAACGTPTASSSSSPTVAATLPATQAASPTPIATSDQLIAVAQRVYGKDRFSVCDGGNIPADAFKQCPFTASLTQKMIHKAATQPGPDPLGAGDGPGMQDAPVYYTATATSTGGTVNVTVGTTWSASLTIVSDNGLLLVDGLIINGVPVT